MAGLSKQESAERLLVQAVKLQFCDGDPYAIHLLLMSSLRTCLDISKSKGVTDIFERIIRPGQRNHFFQSFYSIASFLKHADKDPNGLVSVIGHADRAAPLRDYCLGLIMPCERKSVEPMAAVTAP